jgi:hypothetical protein
MRAAAPYKGKDAYKVMVTLHSNIDVNEFKEQDAHI